MTDLAIVVEGQTEENFVNDVLAPYLIAKGLSAWAVLPGQGHHRRGGRWEWEPVAADIVRLLKQRSDRYCAILFDFYALPTWPGVVKAGSVSPKLRAITVEAELIASLDRQNPGLRASDRFIPHIQLHEYESRLFSDCKVLGSVLNIEEYLLESILESYGDPELINDKRETAPSKQLDKWCRQVNNVGYRKTTDGVTAARRIGIATMRSCCSHFDQWVTRIESLGKADR